MFVGMEDNSKYWKEKLSDLEKGKNIPLEKNDSGQGAYSAIRNNPDLFKNKEFSIRTDRRPTIITGEEHYIKRVIRIK